MRTLPPASCIPIDISENTVDLTLHPLRQERGNPKFKITDEKHEIHHPLPLLVKEGSLSFSGSPPAKGGVAAARQTRGYYYSTHINEEGGLLWQFMFVTAFFR
jgi:hypothetical protein